MIKYSPWICVNILDMISKIKHNIYP